MVKSANCSYFQKHNKTHTLPNITHFHNMKFDTDLEHCQLLDHNRINVSSVS